MEKEKQEVTNEVTETKKEIEPKYTLRPAGATDISTLLIILGKIGINKFSSCLNDKGVQEFIKNVRQQKGFSNKDLETIAGVSVITEVAQVVIMGLPKCEEDIFKLLANTSDLEVDEIKKLDGVTFVEMIIDFLKINWDFIKAASKFVK